MSRDVQSLIRGLSLENFDDWHSANLPVGDGFIRERIAHQSRGETAHALQKEIVQKALRRAGPAGATTSEISRLTGLNSQAARKSLEELCATREAYKLKRNRTTTIYYNNGRPRHEFGTERIEEGSTTYEISLAEGPDDSLLVHIIEKKFTLLEGEQIEGGVIMPISQVPALVKALANFHEIAVGDTHAKR